MFLSLQWKWLFASILTILFMSGAANFVHQNEMERIRANYQLERQVTHVKQLSSLAKQQSDQLVQTLELLITQGNQKSQNALFENISQQQDDLLINRGITNITLYSDVPKLIGERLYVPSEQQRQTVITSGFPLSGSYCLDSCILYALVPVFFDNKTLVIQIEKDIYELVFGFDDITGNNLSILKSDPETGEFSLTLSSNHRQSNAVIAVINNQLVTNSQSTYSANIDQKYIEATFLTPDNFTSNAVFIVEIDITEEQLSAIRYSRDYLIRTVGLTFLIAGLTTLWFIGPIGRVRRNTRLLPMLTRGEFTLYTNKIKQAQPRKLFQDEIDQLETTLLEVTRELQTMSFQLEASAQKMQHLAMYDNLTGLANRLNLTNHLKACLENIESKNTYIQLLFVDLDNFKRVNDSMGHTEGDILLNIVARRMSACIPSTDFICRLGGDEFCIVIESTDETVGKVTAMNILNALKNPVHLKSTQVTISASIGIVRAPEDGDTVEALLQNADIAMYTAKAAGKDTYQAFEQGMSMAIQQEIKLEAELSEALRNNEFVLHYQPQIDLKTNKIVGVEALVRWQHPEKGLVYPDQFISILEHSSLIIVFGEWLIQEACLKIKSWQDQGIHDVSLAINISAKQMHDPGFCTITNNILKATNTDPSLLEFEITESLIMEDIDSTHMTITQLHEMGIQLSIDDFGTGYSSLSYLKQLNVDNLKIDRSFVSDLNSDNEDAAIVSAIIAMAHKLGLSVVAEGIEDDLQRQFLENCGCDYGQGYLISRPVPEDKLLDIISARHFTPA